MKEALSNILYNALKEAKEKAELKIEEEPLVVLEITKDQTKGDIATTVAMALAASEKKKPRDIAEIIISHLRDDKGIIDKTEIAGPGFINFFLKDEYYHQILKQIDKEGKNYGRVDIGKGEKVQVEFVSANPTGPLHVGHGRGAAVGDALSNLLAAVGYNVTREFYINDAGRQVRLLAQSVYSSFKNEPIPEDGYHGGYIDEIAASAKAVISDRRNVISTGPIDNESAAGASQVISFLEGYSKDILLEEIRKDLEDFGVRFDNWFSEQSLLDDSSVKKSIEELKERGFAYEKDDALWLRSTAFGDDKDRVVIKNDGSYTYLATDIAYHRNKLSRGFKKLINIWGADHHGYIPRVQAVIQAFGHPKEALHVLLVQLVAVLRHGKPVPMSKRAGDFVTLRDVIQDVGSDAARFFFLMRRSDSHLDFDLELAKMQSSENPVYYVQYAHARLCSVERQAEERGIKIPDADSVDFGLLKLPEEKNIMKQLTLYPITIEGAARALEPHRITFYLQNLAGLLHNYYFHHRIITDDKALTDARLVLMKGVRQVIKNALDILGIRAPEKM